ncbi:hypothetical protein HY489_03870 [Candidatus Woesearchaeota archaeon]|nr:hypothetical protein [Candidatus Woesearchaeota archaeon]
MSDFIDLRRLYDPARFRVLVELVERSLLEPSRLNRDGYGRAWLMEEFPEIRGAYVGDNQIFVVRRKNGLTHLGYVGDVPEIYRKIQARSHPWKVVERAHERS